MGKLAFGRDETLTCLVDIEMRGKESEQLCLGHKTSKFFVGAGVYLSDDGYILRSKGQNTYYAVTPEELAQLQQEGVVPTPLPPYHISWVDYAFGYSLWIILFGVVGFGVIRNKLRSRRQAVDAATPVSLGPPGLRTKADRWLHEQAAPLLRADETVQHQAYTIDNGPIESFASAAGATSTYVVLTNQRLLLFQARVGAFGPLLEVNGTEELERAAVKEVAVDDRLILLHLTERRAKALFVAPTRKLSNQDAFLRDVPRLLAGSDSSAEVAAA
jgi:hypothetical protein